MKTLPFSDWFAWNERAGIPGKKFPGIYAIVISKKNISGGKFTWRKDISYIGMTNSKGGLNARLNQFDAVLKERSGHGGAERFRYDYEDGKKLASLLYVSVIPFECDVLSREPADLLIMGSVAMAEYEAWAENSGRYHVLPKYNEKARSPKRKKVTK